MSIVGNETKVKKSIDQGNVQIALDAFSEFIKIIEPGTRIDMYDVIIDCRKSLVTVKDGECQTVTFEECKEAFSRLSYNRVIVPERDDKTYMVKHRK